MKWIYYYATQVGDAQELAFENPLQEQDLIVVIVPLQNGVVFNGRSHW